MPNKKQAIEFTKAELDNLRCLEKSQGKTVRTTYLIEQHENALKVLEG